MAIILSLLNSVDSIMCEWLFIRNLKLRSQCLYAIIAVVISFVTDFNLLKTHPRTNTMQEYLLAWLILYYTK